MLRTILVSLFFLLMMSHTCFGQSVKVHSNKIKKPKKIMALKVKKEKQLHCLAKNIYFESRGESFLGQLAIGLVTLERTQSKDYPSDICAVVKQPYAFSWTLNKPKVNDYEAFDRSVLIARLSMFIKEIGLDLLQADHFHSKHLKKYPRWAYHLEEVATIGNHTFYRQ